MRVIGRHHPDLRQTSSPRLQQALRDAERAVPADRECGRRGKISPKRPTEPARRTAHHVRHRLKKSSALPAQSSTDPPLAMQSAAPMPARVAQRFSLHCALGFPHVPPPPPAGSFGPPGPPGVPGNPGGGGPLQPAGGLLLNGLSGGKNEFLSQSPVGSVRLTGLFPAYEYAGTCAPLLSIAATKSGPPSRTPGTEKPGTCTGPSMGSGERYFLEPTANRRARVVVSRCGPRCWRGNPRRENARGLLDPPTRVFGLAGDGDDVVASASIDAERTVWSPSRASAASADVRASPSSAPWAQRKGLELLDVELADAALVLAGALSDTGSHRAGR